MKKRNGLPTEPMTFALALSEIKSYIIERENDLQTYK